MSERPIETSGTDVAQNPDALLLNPDRVKSAENPKEPDSYSEILRSSSIIGGSQAINYLVGMVRTKLVAVLLGPSGVGLVGLYASVTGLLATITGLGIHQSGVRQVAEAHGNGDSREISKTVKSLRRACWVTGFVGWLLTVSLAYPLSKWIFGSGERALPIAALGATLLLGAIASGQHALLQGVRRIGDLARLSVLSVVAGSVVSILIYLWLGVRGIVPVMISVATFHLAISWWFARKVQILPVSQTAAETWRNARHLVGLGLAFMWSGLLAAGVALVIRSMIARTLGLDANGIYQAAWGISGMFAGFILSAMGADFYPRLTAVSADNDRVNQLVNEQTEVGILIALPGLMATLGFAPLAMRIFYTAEFLPGAALLPWFVLGIFARVICWPLGFIQLAKGKSKWFMGTQTCFWTANLLLSLAMLHLLGLPGIAFAFALSYGINIILIHYVGTRLSDFRWSIPVLRLLLLAAALVLAGFWAQRYMSPMLGLSTAILLTGISAILSLHGLAIRLGPHHRLVCLLFRVPGVRRACGI